MRTDEFETQLKGGRLTTAEVLYYMPDYPKLLQSFTWQTLDVAPEYPRVHSFLHFWRKEIQAVIHSIRLSPVGIVTPARVQLVEMVGVLH